MAEERDLLADLLRLQEEIRAIEEDDQALDLTDPDGFQYHQSTNGPDGTNEDTPSKNYVSTTGASIPEGRVIIEAPAAHPGDIKWADTYTNTDDKGGTGGFSVPEGCANGTNCLDENFCYSWYDCEPCQWCENFQCAERDPYRPCAASWECPCAPTEDQDYACVDDRCALSCVENGDCPTGEVCDSRDFLSLIHI